MKYKLKTGFVLRDVCGENAVMAEGLDVLDFNKMIGLNETAAFLWQEAEKMGVFSEQQLADALCREYEVAPETAFADTLKVIRKLQEKGLIEMIG